MTNQLTEKDSVAPLYLLPPRLLLRAGRQLPDPPDNPDVPEYFWSVFVIFKDPFGIPNPFPPKDAVDPLPPLPHVCPLLLLPPLPNPPDDPDVPDVPDY